MILMESLSNKLELQVVLKDNSIILVVLLSITLMEIFIYVTILTTGYKYSQMTILTNHNSV